MPLLHKKPFIPNEFQLDLKESEEVFFCKLTREIFRDYDEFCERIILCNSLVWSCSLTGRSHLTYQEAVASEERVKRLLKRFPMEVSSNLFRLEFNVSCHFFFFFIIMLVFPREILGNSRPLVD
ncbi:hypothetical protein AAG570_003155 [Ranatra chinensis]|uniref:WAC domain-containing protein n=1 Tax=Ranatra chinensis TaxID=642074 RepID=A0ABD0Y727_9HEMI